MVAVASIQEQQLQMQVAVMVRGLLRDRATFDQVEAPLKQAVLGLLQEDHDYVKAEEWTARVLNDALQWDSVINRDLTMFRLCLRRNRVWKVLEFILLRRFKASWTTVLCKIAGLRLCVRGLRLILLIGDESMCQTMKTRGVLRLVRIAALTNAVKAAIIFFLFVQMQ